jgi:hypothetical protein
MQEETMGSVFSKPDVPDIEQQRPAPPPPEKQKKPLKRQEDESKKRKRQGVRALTIPMGGVGSQSKSGIGIPRG